jgi:hypothetical protein
LAPKKPSRAAPRAAQKEPERPFPPKLNLTSRCRDTGKVYRVQIVGVEMVPDEGSPSPIIEIPCLHPGAMPDE